MLIEIVVNIKSKYMTHEQKTQVRDALVRYTGNYNTQAEAAATLDGISAATISLIKNNNWELLSDRLWQHVARQVGFYCGEWQAADTGCYLLLRILFGDAQHYAMTYGIAVAGGLGKTFTALRYTREHGAAYYVAALEEYNRKSFLTALMQSLGMEATGTVPEMMERCIAHIKNTEEPLLIIDDAHKLKDRVLHLLISLVNELSGHAGIIIMGKEQLRNRIIDGVRLKKTGYDEIFKSIGRRFIVLGTPGPKDAELVCHANGFYDDEQIDRINAEPGMNLHKVTAMIRNQHYERMAA